MRNTGAENRGTWATYVKWARDGAALGVTELAARLGIDRGTVHRWENGRTKPENPDIVQRVAEVLRLDLDEALAAAGMRPGTPPPAAPTQERDEELELILSSKASPDLKRIMIQRLEELRERDKQRRLEDLRWMLERST